MSNDPDWYDRLPKWAQHGVDQSAHLGMGLVAGCVAWMGHPIAAAAFAAACVAASREIEQWPPRRYWDLVLDVVVVILGGVVMGLVAWGVTR